MMRPGGSALMCFLDLATDCMQGLRRVLYMLLHAEPQLASHSLGPLLQAQRSPARRPGFGFITVEPDEVNDWLSSVHC